MVALYPDPPIMRPRTRDQYYVCLGLRFHNPNEDGDLGVQVNGQDMHMCMFWCYDPEKAQKHRKKAGWHNVLLIEIPQGAGPSRDFRPNLPVR